MWQQKMRGGAKFEGDVLAYRKGSRSEGDVPPSPLYNLADVRKSDRSGQIQAWCQSLRCRDGWDFTCLLYVFGSASPSPTTFQVCCFQASTPHSVTQLVCSTSGSRVASELQDKVHAIFAQLFAHYFINAGGCVLCLGCVMFLGNHVNRTSTLGVVRLMHRSALCFGAIFHWTLKLLLLLIWHIDFDISVWIVGLQTSMNPCFRISSADICSRFTMFKIYIAMSCYISLLIQLDTLHAILQEAQSARHVFTISNITSFGLTHDAAHSHVIFLWNVRGTLIMHCNMSRNACAFDCLRDALEMRMRRHWDGFGMCLRCARRIVHL